MIHGYDLSRWNRARTPGELRALGARFVLARASYGATVDPKFQGHMSAAQGLGRSAYHWLKEDVDLDAQLEAFFGVVAQPFMTGSIVLALDVEPPQGQLAFKQPRRMAGLVFAFLEELVQPLLYLSPATAAQFTSAERRRFASISRLWIAHYGVAAPHVPEEWPTWTLWQTGTEAGIDRDVLNGGEDAYAAVFGVP